jgi:hypothetical protein
MNLVTWTRLTLCGLIAGGVFTLLTAVLVGTLGSEFLAAAGAHASTGDGVTKTGPSLYFTTVFAGLWAMWLYSVVRPQLTSRMRAVLTVSLAWWGIASLQSLKWILLLGIPLSTCLPLTANLVPTAIAVYVGSVFFGDVQPNKALQPAGSAGG